MVYSCGFNKQPFHTIWGNIDNHGVTSPYQIRNICIEFFGGHTLIKSSKNVWFFTPVLNPLPLSPQPSKCKTMSHGRRMYIGIISFVCKCSHLLRIRIHLQFLPIFPSFWHHELMAPSCIAVQFSCYDFNSLGFITFLMKPTSFPVMIIKIIKIDVEKIP